MAISFVNAVGNGYNAGGGDLTVAGTVNAGADFLVAAVHQFDTNNLANILWNGVAMTLVGSVVKATGSNDWLSAYILPNPAVGSFNLTVDRNDANRNQIAAACYSGVSATGQPDANTSAQGSSGTASSALASVADNSWHFLTLMEFSANAVAGTNTTERVANNDNGGVTIFDSNAAQTPAGSKTQTATFTSSAWVVVQFTLKPSTAVGPANLKTYNTNVKANIKSIDTNLIANVKSLDTNT